MVVDPSCRGIFDNREVELRDSYGAATREGRGSRTFPRVRVNLLPAPRCAVRGRGGEGLNGGGELSSKGVSTGKSDARLETRGFRYASAAHRECREFHRVIAGSLGQRLLA